MKFFKEVWGIIWEFNGIGEFISFTMGRHHILRWHLSVDKVQ